MLATEDRESRSDGFVGHVFAKASPILTWRPTKVQRIVPDPIGDRASDAGGSRFSRAPTRRLVSWPVIAGVQRSRGRAVRALLTLVGLSLLCGSALALSVYTLLGNGSPLVESAAVQAKARPTRVASRHVRGMHVDLLLPPPEPDPEPVQIVASHPSPTPHHAVVATATRAASRGQVMHGRRATLPPAPHATHLAHAAARSTGRAT